MSPRTARSSIGMAFHRSGYLPSVPLRAPPSGRSSPFPTSATNARNWPPTFDPVVRRRAALGAPCQKRLISRSRQKVSSVLALDAGANQGELSRLAVPAHGQVEKLTNGSFSRLLLRQVYIPLLAPLSGVFSCKP